MIDQPTFAKRPFFAERDKKGPFAFAAGLPKRAKTETAILPPKSKLVYAAASKGITAREAISSNPSAIHRP